MAKITRYNGNMQSFASQADTNKRTTFGTTTTGDDTLDGNFTSQFFTGWQIVGPNENPTLEDFNAAFFTLSRVQAYLHQVGMAEWNGAQEYHVNSMVNRAGVIYVCKTNSHTSITAPESDAVNWRLTAAADVGYDNTASGIAATTVQAAIDELDAELLDVFSQQSLATSGYQMLPGGLIAQWGVALQASFTSGESPVTLPITFPNSTLNVQATHNGDASRYYGVALVTSSGFTIYAHTGSGPTNTTVQSFWFAIGY